MYTELTAAHVLCGWVGQLVGATGAGLVMAVLGAPLHTIYSTPALVWVRDQWRTTLCVMVPGLQADDQELLCAAGGAIAAPQRRAVDC